MNKPELTIYEMQDLTTRILWALGKGKENRTLKKNLQQTLGVDERKLRLGIEQLRHEKWAICTIGNGYYLATTQQEVDEFVSYMKKRMISEYHIMKTVQKGASESLHKTLQLPMFLTDTKHT